MGHTTSYGTVCGDATVHTPCVFVELLEPCAGPISNHTDALLQCQIMCDLLCLRVGQSCQYGIIDLWLTVGSEVLWLPPTDSREPVGDVRPGARVEHVVNHRSV